MRERRCFLVVAMTGARFQRRRKVVDGDCSVGISNSRVTTVVSLENCEIEETEKEASVIVNVDLYTQARKALAERSPFDSEDGVDVYTPNLPRELGNLLCKRSDGRKRHKKSHSGVETKSSKAEKSRGAAFWAKNEDYFRGLTVDDIEKLYQASSIKFSDDSDCLLIPLVKNGKTCGVANVSNSNNELAGLEEVKDEQDGQFMEIDNDRGIGMPVEEKYNTSSQQASGLEWLLGSRSKVYLTSERPSKKRKLLGGDAGLEKLFVASAVEGSSLLCHYCSLGDAGDQLNRLIVCSLCSMSVHQRCYGVQEDVSESWLCSWCKSRNEQENSDRPCLLCPKQVGALKPVRKKGCESDSGKCTEFAHLFCCQWMPEVYIEDARKMEPIMNVEGIKETRQKLVCRICKIRHGACVRCSNGACRASFHPICAREARHRMEIWGKFGSDDVELRAFCSKHSEVQNGSITLQEGEPSRMLGSDSNNSKHQQVSSTMLIPHSLKVGRRNGEKVGGHLDTLEMDLDRGNSSVSRDDLLPDSRLGSSNHLECGGLQQPNIADALDKRNNEDTDTTESLSFQPILKKLIDRGRVNVNEVASDIGVSSEFLASNLIGDHLEPELQRKIVDWLKNHAYLGPFQRNLKVRFKNLTKVDTGVTDETNGMVSKSINPDVSITSVLPRRRTKNDIKIPIENKALCFTESSLIADGISISDRSVHDLVRDEPACRSEDSVPDTTQKALLDPVGSQDILRNNYSKIEGEEATLSNCTAIESLRAEESAIHEKNVALDSTMANPVCHTAVNSVSAIIEGEAVSSSYMHPTIQNLLSQMPYLGFTKTDQDIGLRDREFSAAEASSCSSVCSNHQTEESVSPDSAHRFGPILEQLAKARRMGILEQSPVDEVEGELIFYQQRLLCNALARKQFTDDLILKVLTNLPIEIDVIGKQKWDAVTAHKYLSELKEVKRQDRKERRQKEAQAAAAAATAAAAASSRIPSFRKDSQEESAHQDMVNSSSGRASNYSQQLLRAKETLSRLGTSRVSSEKNSDAVHSTSDFSKEHPRTCDVCRRSETILNPILICLSCKVAVHLDCYRSVKDSAGPWYCELCEELSSSRSFGAPAVNSWEKPYSLAECGLCGGTTGAFRKATDGQWIHAFCAEWVLESTFKRGQANPVQGMETISKGSDMCHICRSRQGVCIKCNYGHCQSSFHPSCARSAGFYMNLKTSGAKLQHKAYCERHSLVERAKVETQKHGIEEIKSLKPVRVELEKLRLLCERIIKREKLKRELVFCSHEILAQNMEAVALSPLTCSSFCPTDVSSESATTSLKGYTDDYKLGNEAMQRSDDITVDSTVAGKRRIIFPLSTMDIDQKTDDSSTSQQPLSSKPSDRASFSGKQIPSRPSSVTSWSFPSEGEKRAKFRKHNETFEKELVMTSDQASMKNQRLPKGFVYVPIRCLSNEKESVPDACTQELLKSDE